MMNKLPRFTPLTLFTGIQAFAFSGRAQSDDLPSPNLVHDGGIVRGRFKSEIVDRSLRLGEA